MTTPEQHFIRFKRIGFPLIFAFIVLSDQWTKYLIVKHFELGESISVVSSFFQLTYLRNPGAAFGLFAHAPPFFRTLFFMVLPPVTLLGVFLIFWRLRDQTWKFYIGLTLILSGAFGNYLDRLHSGSVVDFLDFHWYGRYHFPPFNLADTAITLGVGLLLLDLYLGKRTCCHAPHSV